MIVTNDAIVLSSRKFSDTSKIITVFTKDYGKVSLIAKGARTMKSKFGSSIEPLSSLTATFYLKPNTDLYLLSKSEILNKWIRIYNSSEHIAMGFALVETVSITQEVKHPNSELYSMLSDCLSYLNELPNNPGNCLIWFFYKYAEFLGFDLNLTKEFSDDYIYTILIDTGSVISNTQIRHRLLFKMKGELLTKLKQVSENELHAIDDIAINKIKFSTLYNFFGTYFSYHLDMNFVLKSGSIL